MGLMAHASTEHLMYNLYCLHISTDSAIKFNILKEKIKRHQKACGTIEKLARKSSRHSTRVSRKDHTTR